MHDYVGGVVRARVAKGCVRECVCGGMGIWVRVVILKTTYGWFGVWMLGYARPLSSIVRRVHTHLIDRFFFLSLAGLLVIHIVHVSKALLPNLN